MAKKTGVQENRGYTQTDDFITRTHILPLLIDKKKRKELLDEHKNNPIGQPGCNGRAGIQHSEDLQRVIDKFRRRAMAGKYVRICKTPHKDYPSEDACEHEIFKKRVNDLLKEYGYK